MKLVRNSDGCYARHYVINQEVSRFKSKCLERRVVNNRRRGRQMFLYDSRMLDIDPLLFFAAAIVYSKIR